MSECSKDNYEDFFTGIRDFKILQNKQKQRGLNNYNLLTAVLSPSDEVRLHSRMIYSLLDPNGKHFQGTLFLERFLKVLNIEGFDSSNLSLDSCSVYKEYENIDLYITDGTKHIIIENKVHAGDQKNQIKRYIEIIKKEDIEADATDVLVLYLTLDGKVPSAHSLGGLSIEDDKLVKGGSEEAFYKSIQYKVEIMAWLEACQHEVQNITNLNQAIAAYQDVVKMINKEYQGKAMSLADYIIKDEKGVYAMALEVSKAMPELRKTISDSYFGKVVEQLRGKLGDDWVVEIKGCLSTSCGFPLRAYKKEWDETNSLIFGFEFSTKDYNNCFLGVVRRNKNMDNTKNVVVKRFEAEIKKCKENIRANEWWLDQNTFLKGDLVEYIRTEENAEQKLVDTFLGLIDVFERNSNLLTTINDNIQNKKVNL